MRDYCSWNFDFHIGTLKLISISNRTEEEALFGSLKFALYTIFTILLTVWKSDQKNGLLVKLFYFHLILMKLGEVIVHMGMGTTTSPSFIKIGWKTKKFS